MTKLFLGVDLGGTAVKLAIVDDKGKIVQQNSFPNSCPSDPDKVVRGIIYNFHKIVDRLFRQSTRFPHR